jgi:arylsulfatase
MIASWPAKIKSGRKSDHISAFQDLLPTFCDIAGVTVSYTTDGISFLPELTGGRQESHEYLYWEFPESGGQQAVLIGDYKAIRKNMHKGNTQFELFDLSKDPGETVDIAADWPEIITNVQSICLMEHSPSENPRWKFKILND